MGEKFQYIHKDQPLEIPQTWMSSLIILNT